DLAVGRVTTAEDEFLTITASLGIGALARLAPRYPSIAARLAHQAARRTAPAAHGAPEIVSVDTPAISEVLDALADRGGRLPEVAIRVPERDADGRLLEWTWSLARPGAAAPGGLWRPFATGGVLRIRDRALAIQGVHGIALRA